MMGLSRPASNAAPNLSWKDAMSSALNSLDLARSVDPAEQPVTHIGMSAIWPVSRNGSSAVRKFGDRRDEAVSICTKED